MSEQLLVGTYIFFLILGSSLGLFIGYALGIREGSTIVSNAIFGVYEDDDDDDDALLDAKEVE